MGSLQEGKEAWPMVLLGDGQLRVELEELCAELGLRTAGCLSHEGTENTKGECLKLNSYKLKTRTEAGLVVFAGFRQVEELPFFYAGAGAFIHPALSEPWGLVINEAMASGLPILSSKNVGAAEELVQEGVNGFSFNPASVEELAAVLERMAELPLQKREAMGSASKSIISNWGPERFAHGVQEAVRAAMSAPAKCAGILDWILLEILIRK
jgi:glycosyltransferase involved in cell wall biosynthesis